MVAKDALMTWDSVFSPIKWDAGRLVLLDQRLLPEQEVWRHYEDATDVAEAIRKMVVRGAPAIGCAAALGLAAAALRYPDDVEGFNRALMRDIELLKQSRPTAVNLFWALEHQQLVARQALEELGADAAKQALEQQALKIWRDDVASCRAMGRLGAELIPERACILTHCNAGALATGGYGTALGVVRAAAESGKQIRVYADETRPFLQGARLTAWELHKSGIDVTVSCDNMAGALMQRGEISCCVVGADRIAANGDVANKIGTYMVAALAKRHGVPFYVAAPRSTIDLGTPTGAEIPIEERPSREVTHIGDTALAPEAVGVRNIAFDVTPAELVTAIVTEVGVAQPPSEQSIRALMD